MRVYRRVAKVFVNLPRPLLRKEGITTGSLQILAEVHSYAERQNPEGDLPEDVSERHHPLLRLQHLSSVEREGGEGRERAHEADEEDGAQLAADVQLSLCQDVDQAEEEASEDVDGERAERQMCMPRLLREFAQTVPADGSARACQ